MHDPGDEHRDRGHRLHRAWPARNRSFGYGNAANDLGAVVRCGDFVPLRWATHIGAVVDCPACLDLDDQAVRP